MTSPPFRPSLEFADKEAHIAGLLAQGKREACLQLIVAETNLLCTDPAYNGRALYLPGLDKVLATIAAQIDANAAPCPKPATPWDVVVVATQMESQGGHSRVIEDICQAVPNPLLILTDAYDSYADGRLDLAQFYERVPQALVVVIPRGMFINKAQELHQVCRSLDARNVLVLTHHSDPVAFAGIASVQTSPAMRKFLVHHADHNPALGMTLASFVHVDCTEYLRGVCSAELGRAAHLLPLTAPDLGPRPERAWPQKICSTVTAGSASKFRREGEFAYVKTLTRILTVIEGRHHHIGTLPGDWVSDIRAGLQSRGIDPGRFVYLGSVPSLWQALKSVDADFYVASAPVAGGRAAIEAQGCGFPVAYFKHPDQPHLFQIDEVYASRELAWSGLDDLQQCLAMDGARLRACAEAARRHYLKHHSPDAFRTALQGLLDAAA